MSYTQQLHQLQQIDNQLQAVKARLAEISANLVESEALKSAKIAFDQADVTYRQAGRFMTDLELEVKGLQDRIAQNETWILAAKCLYCRSSHIKAIGI